MFNLIIYFLISGALTTNNLGMPLLNETWDPKMGNASSAEFKRIADPFCSEVS